MSMNRRVATSDGLRRSRNAGQRIEAFNLVAAGPFWALNKRLLAALNGNWIAAGIVAELESKRRYYAERRQLDADGGFYVLNDELERALHISKHVRLRTVKLLTALGIVTVREKTTRAAGVGLQTLNFYYIDDRRLSELCSPRADTPGASSFLTPAVEKLLHKEEVREEEARVEELEYEAKRARKFSSQVKRGSTTASPGSKRPSNRPSGFSVTKDSDAWRLRHAWSDILALYPKSQDLIAQRRDQMADCLDELKAKSMTRSDAIKVRRILVRKWTPPELLLSRIGEEKRSTWLAMIDMESKAALREVFPTERQAARDAASREVDLTRAMEISSVGEDEGGQGIPPVEGKWSSVGPRDQTRGYPRIGHDQPAGDELREPRGTATAYQRGDTPQPTATSGSNSDFGDDRDPDGGDLHTGDDDLVAYLGKRAR